MAEAKETKDTRPKLVIGSRLPNALILHHPDPAKKHLRVTIKGLNSAGKTPSGARLVIPYATTEVDKEFWEEWFFAHNHPTNPFGPLKSGALFVAKTPEAAEKVYREREKELTGLESMGQRGDSRMGADAKKLAPATSD